MLVRGYDPPTIVKTALNQQKSGKTPHRLCRMDTSKLNRSII